MRPPGPSAALSRDALFSLGRDKSGTRYRSSWASEKRAEIPAGLAHAGGDRAAALHHGERVDEPQDASCGQISRYG
jgi:hypothetical protein